MISRDWHAYPQAAEPLELLCSLRLPPLPIPTNLQYAPQVEGTGFCVALTVPEDCQAMVIIMRRVLRAMGTWARGVFRCQA